MHNSHKIKAIRKRMQQVRRDLDKDVQEIVEGVRDMGEWRTYVRSYPWTCLGAALAVGYMIVPRRHLAMPLDAETLAELAKQSRLAVTSEVAARSDTGRLVLAFVGHLVVRGVASYVGQRVGKFFAPQAVKLTQSDQP